MLAENPTMNLMQQCGQLLQITFKSGNQDERKLAEQTLKQLSQKGDQFLEALISIITMNDSSEEAEQLKSAAANYLEIHIKADNVQIHITNQQNYQRASLILQAMIQEHLKLSLRITLSICLNNILFLQGGDEIKKNLFPVVMGALQLKHKGIIGGMIALQTFTNTTNESSKLLLLYKESIDPLIELGNMIVDAVLNDLAALGMNINNEQAVVKMGLLLESLRVWTETIKNFISKLDKHKGNLLEHVINKENLILVFTKALCIYLNTELQIKDCFISTCGFERLDQLMNDVKIKVLRCMNKVFEFIFEIRGQIKVTTSKFYSLLPTILPLLIKTIINFCTCEKIDLTVALDKGAYESLVTEILILLTLLGKHPEFYYIFAENKKALLADVILPLMRTGKSEIEMMNENPGEFVSLAIDTCDNQISETTKTQAAQFMETMCDNIDGSLTFISILSVSLIDFTISSNNLADIPSKFSTLNDFTNSLILTKTQPNIRVETCLIILAALSYILPKRKDLLELFEKMIANYSSFFLTTEDPLIRSRYCLAVSYYYNDIFKDKSQKEEFEKQMRFLVDTLGLRDKQYLIAVHQACDGLKSIFEDADMIPRLSPIINDVLVKFAQMISSMKVTDFFEMVQEIVSSYSKQIVTAPEGLALLVKALSQQIETEVKNQENTSHEGNIIFQKCWNIIKTIGDQKIYVPLFKEIEEMLLPLYECLQTPQKISFDDDVLLLVNAFIRQSAEITEIQWRLAATFTAIFEKNKHMLNNLFTTMNLMIYYGRTFLSKNLGVVDMFIDLSCKAIFCDYKRANEANQAEGALMLHLIIQYFGELLNAKQWEKMICTVLDRFNKEIKTTFLKARLLGVILHGFSVNYPITEEILQSREMTAIMINAIIFNINMFIHSYDRKTFVIGMSSIFIQKNLSPFVSQQIPQMFEAVVTMLRIIQSIEKAETLRKKKGVDDLETIPSNEQIINNILQDFQKTDELLQKVENNLPPSDQMDDERGDEDDYEDVDDSDDDDGDDDDDSDDSEEEEDEGYMFDNEYGEAQSTVEQLLTEFKNRDEFSYFNTIVMKLKEINEAAIKQIAMSLPQAKQEYLKQILQSHRVIVDPTENKTVARKIVTVKGKKTMN